MNEYGLPRAVDEVEMNLGVLKLHVLPHQVFIVKKKFYAVASAAMS